MKYLARRVKKTPGSEELNITAFLNLMVILVPFLLITATFTQLTILEVNLPTSGTDVKQDKKAEFDLQIIFKAEGIDVTNGNQLLKSIAKNDNQYDYRTLNLLLQQVKAYHLDTTRATIRLQQSTNYDTLIQAMDATRSFVTQQNGEWLQADLFPDISINDAPTDGKL